MERLNEESIMDSVKKAIGYKPGAVITFKCKECKCDGNMHGINPVLNSCGINDIFGSDVKRICSDSFHNSNDVKMKKLSD